MNDRTTVYATYYNPIEANIVKSRLEDSGFPCFLADENLATIQPMYNQAIGGVRLIVFERDVEKISALLAENPDEVIYLDEGTADEITVHCEVCDSTNVSYGLATEKRFALWATVLAFLTASYPIKANKCYHCYNCGHEFNAI